MKKMPKWLLVILILFGLALLIQLVPYGHNHTNAAVVNEPKWDSPKTRELAKVACFDCHSNEVVWPWYSNIAPVSWLVQHDVDEGQQIFNFSQWDPNGLNPPASELVQAIQRGKMPPAQYLIIHTNAKLSDADKQALIAGLQASLGQ
jgi:cytochrome c551/c552